VNVADTLSYKHPSAGQYQSFENPRTARFPHYGIGIHVLWPGQPNAMYHAESNQESFMVLEGECLLLVEGEERPMKKWDFFHCAPMTRHVTVGAGDGPCAILMVGARLPDDELEYPHDPVAAKHDVQAPIPTGDQGRLLAARGRVDTRPIPLAAACDIRDRRLSDLAVGLSFPARPGNPRPPIGAAVLRQRQCAWRPAGVRRP
jgi:uncharacterized cupin superfamily protein